MRMEQKPTFVYRDCVITEESYVEWLHEVKARFRTSQMKAAVRVNTSMLAFYWSIGRDLVALSAEQRWGAGVVKQFAMDMRQAFPSATGFSLSNVKYMKQWYSFYYECVANGQRPVGQLEMPRQFGLIPWGQHIEIFSKCKSLDEALFYVGQTIENGWSRPEVEAQIAGHLFQDQGAAVTNFADRLPAPQGDLAQELLKGEYNLEFLQLKAKHDERELEEKIASNVTRFLLELGKGFSYVGRQMELQMPGGQTFFPDLVFYHIPQHRYMVVELKAVKFVPEHAGKLNFYVTAADRLLRGDGDNPSIGLLICRSMDKTLVEWSLADIQKPLGVATYQIQEVVDRTIKEMELEQKNR